MKPSPETLDQALGALRQASRDYHPAAVEDEYNRLFVGLGCGEMVPYASWYRERMIQSSAIGILAVRPHSPGYCEAGGQS